MSFLRNRSGNLFCGCEKGYIIQLDIVNYKFISNKKKIHNDDVISLVSLSDYAFASGSWDYLIKIWKY